MADQRPPTPEAALRLIEENKRTKDPYLDLGYCGLTHFPKELEECVWLKTLILSEKWYEYDIVKNGWYNKFSTNRGKAGHKDENKLYSLRGIEGCTLLEKLIVAGRYGRSYGLRNLKPLSGLKNLQHLDCSDTQVSDLSSLSGLLHLQLLKCSYT